MKSDLAKSLQGAPLDARPDAELVIAYLGGAHEIAELTAEIAALEDRLREAKLTSEALRHCLSERHPAGKNFAGLGSLLKVRSKTCGSYIDVEPIEVLELSAEPDPRSKVAGTGQFGRTPIAPRK